MRKLIYIFLFITAFCQGQIINSYAYVPVGYDPDAQAFIDAVATLTPTQEIAIDNLVKGLKANGTWSKYHAIYPFIGGTASAHKWNLKDPRDLDVAFRLSFNGTITHDANGIKGDGSTGYADTFFNPSTESLSLTSAGLSIYKQTIDAGSSIDIGNTDNVSLYNFFGLVYSGASNKDVGSVGGHGGADYAPNTGAVKSAGLVGVFTNGTRDAQHYINGVENGLAQLQTDAFTSSNIYICAGHHTGIYLPSSVQFSFASISDGLTPTEVANDYTVIQNYQTFLGRQI